MTKNEIFFNKIKRGISTAVACCILAASWLPVSAPVYADETPEIYDSGTAEPGDFTPTPTPDEGYEQETPSPTAEVTEVPTETPGEDPTETPGGATPEPVTPEDGVPSLVCDKGYAAVSLDGEWVKAEYGNVDIYGNYDGTQIGRGDSFTVPGVVCSGNEVMILEKHFRLSGFDNDESRVLLRVNRIMYDAKIYVNGTFVKQIEFSYIGDKIDISEYVFAGDNSLNIAVASGTNSVYKAGNALGIDGSVTLENRQKISIEKIQIDPAESGSVRIKVTVDVDGDFEGQEKLDVNIYELGLSENGVGATHKGVGFGEETVAANATEIVFDVALRDFTDSKKWSPDNPFLYEADLTLAGISKKVVFGIREVSVGDSETYLSINGKRVFMSGITLDYAIISRLGICTEKNIRSFVSEVKKLGVNTIKGRGVVFSPAWHTVCDEAGILLISEYPLGIVVDGIDGESDAEKFIGDIEAAASSCYNYASCVIWDLAGEDFPVDNLAKAVAKIAKTDKYGRPFSTGLSKPSGAGFVVECDVSQLGRDFFIGDLEPEEPLMHTAKALDWNVSDTKSVRIVTKMFGNVLTRRTDDDFPTESGSWWSKTLEMLGTDDIDKGFSEVLCSVIEYWRSSRKYGGIILPCEVVEAAIRDSFYTGGNSAAAGSGKFFNESFEKALKNGFSTIGVNIKSHIVTGGRGDTFDVDVAVTNNSNSDLETVKVHFTVSVGQKVIYDEIKQYDSLKALGDYEKGRDDIEIHRFSFTVPKSIKDGTEMIISATVDGSGETVSTRNAVISGGETYEAPYSQMAVIITALGAGAIILIGLTISLFRSGAFNIKRRKKEKR
ncbi:MAG: hypothetical protein J5921_02550 [Clostridia bacterium]|nr:hypothetical protein [Clostridia bacterium]